MLRLGLKLRYSRPQSKTNRKTKTNRNLTTRYHHPTRQLQARGDPGYRRWFCVRCPRDRCL